jgi:glutamine cyclotransferase
MNFYFPKQKLLHNEQNNMRLYLLIFCVLLSAACTTTAPTNKNTAVPNTANTNITNTAVKPVPSAPQVYTYEVVNTYKHDPKAFTQGLIFHEGFLYEGTGQEGESSLRKVELETGKVVQKHDLPATSFGEGIALVNDKIYQLTWQEYTCRVFNLQDFKLLKEFNYQGEGWGLTTDGQNLYMTDGSHLIRVINPENFQVIRTVAVFREDGRPLINLNEAEFIKGEIWANIWHSEEPDILGKPNYIARIDPNSGKLLGWVDLGGISPEDVQRDPENTLNGIAYDAAGDRIFVTGKNWKKLFEIKVKPKE